MINLDYLEVVREKLIIIWKVLIWVSLVIAIPISVGIGMGCKATSGTCGYEAAIYIFRTFVRKCGFIINTL